VLDVVDSELDVAVDAVDDRAGLPERGEERIVDRRGDHLVLRAPARQLFDGSLGGHLSAP
jgi:hypothetical protein